jgi:hypothetical protein
LETWLWILRDKLGDMRGINLTLTNGLTPLPCPGPSLVQQLALQPDGEGSLPLQGGGPVTLSAFLAAQGLLPRPADLPPPSPFVRRAGLPAGAEVEGEAEGEELALLQALLQEEYRAHWQDEDLQVLEPRVGMRCGVRSGRDGALHRAVVRRAGEAGNVEVNHVNSGRTEEVQCEVAAVVVAPALATSVRLADVAPATGDWRPEEVAGLAKLITNRFLAMFVEQRATDTHLAKVLLYEKTEDRDICINAVMVKQGLAISLAGTAAGTVFPKPRLPMQARLARDPVTCIVVEGCCRCRVSSQSSTCSTTARRRPWRPQSCGASRPPTTGRRCTSGCTCPTCCRSGAAPCGLTPPATGWQSCWSGSAAWCR